MNALRAFDNWECYDNGRGLPFNGKFTFYKLGTSELIEITDVDGTQLSNPILSDMYGRTRAQVFLPYEDVTVVLHQYIGSGTMSEANTNDSDWTLIRSIDSLYPRFENEVSGNVDSVLIDTMQDLRAVDPLDHNYYTLLGYYELGDMPPVNYTVEYNTTATEDAGSIVRLNPEYILRMVPPRVIDVRSFGVFPKAVYTTPTAYDSQLALAFSYANRLGRDLYMPAIFEGSNSYYWLEGFTFSLAGRLITDWRVRISGKSGTSNIMHIGEIQHTGGTELFTQLGGTGDITCNVSRGKVRTSWLSDVYPQWIGNATNVIMDTVRANDFTVNNAVVEVERTISNKVLRFNNCKIECDHKFLHCDLYLDNCGIVSDMWLDESGAFGQISLSNNVIRLDHMSTANRYVEWKNIQSEVDYGDLGEQEVDIVVYDGAIVENAFGKITAAQHVNTVEIHNFSGTLSGFDGVSLNMMDCYVTFQNTTTIDDIRINRGSLSCASAVTFVGSFNATDVEVNMPMVTTGIVPVYNGCSIKQAIVGQNMKFYNCSIEANIASWDNSGIVNFVFDGCRFSGSGKHILASTEGHGSSVRGTWVNNYSEVDDPIVIDANAHLYAEEDSHSYVYKNNSGKFLEQYPKKVTAVQNYSDSLSGMKAIFPVQRMASIDYDPVIGADYKNFLGYWIGEPDDMSFLSLPFFSIGKVRAVIRLTAVYGFKDDLDVNQKVSCSAVKTAPGAATGAHFVAAQFRNTMISGYASTFGNHYDDAVVEDDTMIILERIE